MSTLDQRANLHGKVAAIVGGASGIGAAVTLALADAGVDVAFCDINANALTATRTDCGALRQSELGRSRLHLPPMRRTRNSSPRSTQP